MTCGYKLHSIVYYRANSKGNQRDGAFKWFVLGQSEHERNALPQEKRNMKCEDLVLKWYDAWYRGIDCVRASLRGAHVTYDER
jgi:hypothetical protein